MDKTTQTESSDSGQYERKTTALVSALAFSLGALFVCGILLIVKLVAEFLVSFDEVAALLVTVAMALNVAFAVLMFKEKLGVHLHGRYPQANRRAIGAAVTAGLVLGFLAAVAQEWPA